MGWQAGGSGIPAEACVHATTRRRESKPTNSGFGGLMGSKAGRSGGAACAASVPVQVGPEAFLQD